MSLPERKIILHAKASKFQDANVLKKYEDFSKEVMWKYHNDNSLSKLSSNYNILLLPQNLQDTAQELISNKDFTVVIVDRVLHHDNIALSMYRILYKDIHPELTLTTWEVFMNDTLQSIYRDKGANSAAIAEMNAELWLASKVGESCIMGEDFA